MAWCYVTVCFSNFNWAYGYRIRVDIRPCIMKIIQLFRKSRWRLAYEILRLESQLFLLKEEHKTTVEALSNGTSVISDVIWVEQQIALEASDQHAAWGHWVYYLANSLDNDGRVPPELLAEWVREAGLRYEELDPKSNQRDRAYRAAKKACEF
jgi:hypothetical protein